ncbi:MAG: hypothetical protein CTY28_12480 [Hyphomicrobium sp.]|jgi:hypothetical protein|nr:hypothetical protein [Hyphomicrobium sp.]PPD06781.1 MAG: hypothetical protein CTY28_12480 [Hyphomicrobium sp.]
MDSETADWPAQCVSNAAANHEVPSGISQLLQRQIEGPAQERSLKSSELNELARTLVAALGGDPEAGEAA